MRSLFLSALFVVLACTIASNAVAQTFASNAGLTHVQPIAKDSIGNDAVLIQVLAFGADPVTGASAFNMETGLSNHWIYRYYSRSRNDVYTHIVTEPAPGYFSGLGEVTEPDPGVNETIAIDTNGSHASSATMVAAVRANAVYQAFGTTNGSVLIGTVTMTKGTAPFAGMPAGFEWNDELWVMYFEDDDDSLQQMVCVVAANTGQTYCVSGTLGVDDEQDVHRRAKISVVPNPATGVTRVTVDASSMGRSLKGVRIGLFNGTGEEVLDLTDSFEASGYRQATFDASNVPSGSYFCRAVGAGINAVIGTIVLGD